MDTVYILEPGCYIRREGASLKVFKDKTLIDQIPAAGLKRLTLIGYVSLSGAVLDFLIQNRIETVFMTPTGRFRARLAIDEHRHVALRESQFLKLSDREFALKTAVIFVGGKLRNMVHLVSAHGSRYGNQTLKAKAARINAILRQCSKPVSDVKIARGIEGAATQIYFSAFGELIRNPMFTFKGRNRRPPLDPVNALLSFVYTLLTNAVLSAIKASGLDPYYGALHEVSYGRPSLACDLVEEYRSHLADRLVLSIINRKMVTPNDFIYRADPPNNYIDEQEMREKRPVEMKPQIRKTLVASYEEMMNRKILYPPEAKRVTYRHLLLKQARAFGKYLKDPDSRYQPFEWE